MVTKRLSLVLAAITLATISGYFLTGKLIQKNYYETLAKYNSLPNVKVNLLSYDRGVFHSVAKITVELGTDNLNDAQVIPLKQIITHGPVIAANTPSGPSIKLLVGQISSELGEPWQNKLEEYTTSKNPLSIVTQLSFSKNASTWIRFAGVEQKTPTNFHVAWDTINGMIEHDLNFNFYHGFIALPALQIDNDNWNLQIKNLVLNLDANNKDALYSSTNTVTTELISYSKDAKETIKLDAITAKLAFFTKDNSLGLDIEAKVNEAIIADQSFKDDNIKLQANNLNRTALRAMPRIGTMNAKATLDLLQELTINSTDLELELPKHFTEALISYVSFEIYRSSYLGKYDNRAPITVLQDITGSINKLVKGAVQKELFLDNGTHYALNFNRSPQS